VRKGRAALPEPPRRKAFFPPLIFKAGAKRNRRGTRRLGRVTIGKSKRWNPSPPGEVLSLPSPAAAANENLSTRPPTIAHGRPASTVQRSLTRSPRDGSRKIVPANPAKATTRIGSPSGTCSSQMRRSSFQVVLESLNHRLPRWIAVNRSVTAWGVCQFARVFTGTLDSERLCADP